MEGLGEPYSSPSDWFASDALDFPNSRAESVARCISPERTCPAYLFWPYRLVERCSILATKYCLWSDHRVCMGILSSSASVRCVEVVRGRTTRDDVQKRWARLWNYECQHSAQCLGGVGTTWQMEVGPNQGNWPCRTLSAIAMLASLRYPLRPFLFMNELLRVLDTSHELHLAMDVVTTVVASAGSTHKSKTSAANGQSVHWTQTLEDRERTFATTPVICSERHQSRRQANNRGEKNSVTRSVNTKNAFPTCRMTGNEKKAERQKPLRRQWFILPAREETNVWWGSNDAAFQKLRVCMRSCRQPSNLNNWKLWYEKFATKNVSLQKMKRNCSVVFISFNMWCRRKINAEGLDNVFYSQKFEFFSQKVSLVSLFDILARKSKEKKNPAYAIGKHLEGVHKPADILMPVCFAVKIEGFADIGESGMLCWDQLAEKKTSKKTLYMCTTASKKEESVFGRSPTRVNVNAQLMECCS